MSAKSYIYACAKLRALEPSILDETDIERMVDAPDLNTAFKVLNDTDYGDNLLEVEPTDYRLALSDDYGQLYELLKTLSPDVNLFKLIFLDRDLVNLKLLFKAKYFEVDVTKTLKENAVYSPEKLKDYIVEQKDTGLDQDIKELINQAKKNLPEESPPDQIDTELTKRYFELMLRLAKRIGNSFITGYVTTLINNANVLTLIRSERLNLEKQAASQKFIAGGTISTLRLQEAFVGEIKNLKSLIAVHYNKEVADAFGRYIDEDLLFEFEKSLEDYKTRYLDKAKRIASGPEVILAYHNAKQNAVAVIRVIMTGKLNKISSEEIKKTLRVVR